MTFCETWTSELPSLEFKLDKYCSLKIKIYSSALEILIISENGLKLPFRWNSGDLNWKKISSSPFDWIKVKGFNLREHLERYVLWSELLSKLRHQTIYDVFVLIACHWFQLRKIGSNCKTHHDFEIHPPYKIDKKCNINVLITRQLREEDQLWDIHPKCEAQLSFLPTFHFIPKNLSHFNIRNKFWNYRTYS